jgi:hypothetical protein
MVTAGVGLGLLAVSLVSFLSELSQEDSRESDLGLADTALRGGLVLFAMSRVWGIIDVTAAVSRTNAILDGVSSAPPGPVAVGEAGTIRLRVGATLPLEWRP